MVEDNRTGMTKENDKSGAGDKVDTDEKMEYVEKVNVVVRVIDAGKKITVGWVTGVGMETVVSEIAKIDVVKMTRVGMDIVVAVNLKTDVVKIKSYAATLPSLFVGSSYLDCKSQKARLQRNIVLSSTLTTN
ncbi:hypothetical protein Adt_36932 [Abeliophyllum distichum]|uniref:Uncharacterized protein n=1 Tax=Abeliophyllum distichum TaxID=126358 RepID=A0ABD1QIY7_9LAMI